MKVSSVCRGKRNLYQPKAHLQTIYLTKSISCVPFAGIYLVCGLPGRFLIKDCSVITQSHIFLHLNNEEASPPFLFLFPTAQIRCPFSEHFINMKVAQIGAIFILSLLKKKKKSPVNLSRFPSLLSILPPPIHHHLLLTYLLLSISPSLSLLLLSKTKIASFSMSNCLPLEIKIYGNKMPFI